MVAISSRKSHKALYRALYFILTLFILTYIIYKVFLAFSQSLFVRNNDRINIVIYDQPVSFYSFDRNGARDYIMYLYPDLKVQVPGGYGEYRTGALGKLVDLEKREDLYKKVFSGVTTTFVDLYFYDKQESREVRYGTSVPDTIMRPSLSSILLLSSNASLFDRLYLAFFLLGKDNDDFTQLRYSEEENKIHNDILFAAEGFSDKSIGLLFQKQYRDEQKSVQILYLSNYRTAEKLARILEGNGIRVSDISLDLSKSASCRIIIPNKEISHTASVLSSFFDCPLEEGKTDVYDILFILGGVEEEWKIRS